MYKDRKILLFFVVFLNKTTQFCFAVWGFFASKYFGLFALIFALMDIILGFLGLRKVWGTVVVLVFFFFNRKRES